MLIFIGSRSTQMQLLDSPAKTRVSGAGRRPKLVAWTKEHPSETEESLRY